MQLVLSSTPVTGMGESQNIFEVKMLEHIYGIVCELLNINKVLGKGLHEKF